MELKHPKEFYINYQADNKLDDIDYKLIEEIIKFNPESVFEFGCGSGKNLMLVKKLLPNVITYGIDISILNVIQAYLLGVDCVIRGDERYMQLGKFDVSFTCSVLDHIPNENINQVIGNLKAISKKAVVIAETNELDGNFYYKHNFEKFGFKKVSEAFKSQDDGLNYYIWIYLCAE